jgi:hypothetical protein
LIRIIQVVGVVFDVFRLHSVTSNLIDTAVAADSSKPREDRPSGVERLDGSKSVDRRFLNGIIRVVSVS